MKREETPRPDANAGRTAVSRHAGICLYGALYNSIGGRKMRFGKKVFVVAIMGIMVAMAAEHEAHAGCIGHGAASGYDRDAYTGPGVRTVYMDELPEVWTPESFITLDDGGCIVIEGAEKDGHRYTRTRGNDRTTWTIDGMTAAVCPRTPVIPGMAE